jgi:hypothetical protein
MAEGGGFLAGDAPLREQAKHLTEGAVHAGGGGEVAAGGIKFGKVE